jgi:hypothetical protein
MAQFQVKYQTTISGNTKGGITSTTVSASSLFEAKNKVKAMMSGRKITIISCVKVGN